MFKKLLANFLFMLVVLLLAVEYMPNKNSYIFVGVISCILSTGLYAIDRSFKRITTE
ncbi:hypothetical protein OCF62_00125 [Bacillus wiedmannii]|uniref:hypothetical protein n=1 Tax=Bacillus wiedmannii TaxID=1890302 RepID=UPI0021D2A558|nr:hypothetical protein [Bacillus wiedmannii]MCU5512980.1 hypothetical protein [Bacillus wiedmannii]